MAEINLSQSFTENLAGNCIFQCTDTTNGYTYIITGSETVLLKFKTSTMAFVGQLVGVWPTTSFRTMVIDTTNLKGYIVLQSNPTVIYKVSLGSGDAAPTLDGTLTLNSGETTANTSGNKIAIDVTNQKLYLPTNGGVLVKMSCGTGTNPPTRDAGLTLSAGENTCSSIAIDVTNQKGYIACAAANPATVVKCSLDGTTTNAPTRDGALTLNSGENNCRASVIDVANQKGYFATTTSPSILVKLSLAGGTTNAPTRDGALTFNAGENSTLTLSIDASANQKVYAGLSLSPAKIVKCSVAGGTTNAPTRDNVLTLNSGENISYGSDLDVSNQKGYWVTQISGGANTNVVRVSLAGTTTNAPTRDTATVQGNGACRCQVYDSTTGYLYALDTSSPPNLLKIDTTTMTQVASLAGSAADWGSSFALNGSSLAIDTVNKKIYGVMSTSPAKVVKWSCGSGSNAPTRDGALTLSVNEARCIGIDVTNQKGYVGCVDTAPGKVVKISLAGGTTNAPTEDGVLTLNAGELCKAVAIDVTNQKGYFCGNTNPFILVKCSLDGGTTNAPTRDGAVTAPSGSNGVVGMMIAIDVTNQKVYVGASASPGRLVKLSCGSGTNAPTVDNTLTLDTGFNSGVLVGINTGTQKGYMANSVSGTSYICQVSLDGATTNAPTADEYYTFASTTFTTRSLWVTQENIEFTASVPYIYQFTNPFKASTIASSEQVFTPASGITVFPGTIATAAAVYTPTVDISAGDGFPFWYVFHAAEGFPFWYRVGKFPIGGK